MTNVGPESASELARFASDIGPRGLCPLVPYISLVALAAIVYVLYLAVLRRNRNQVFRPLSWWSERIGLWVLLNSLLMVALNTGDFFHFAAYPGSYSRLDFPLMMMGCSQALAFGFGTALAGLTVSMIIRGLKESKATSQQPPPN